MTRAIIELLFTVLLIVVARALLTNFFTGLANASRTFQNQSGEQQAGRGGNPNGAAGDGPPKTNTSELHKDPVCGTYVAISTPYQRQTGRQVFYYCSTECREKHALVAR